MNDEGSSSATKLSIADYEADMAAYTAGGLERARALGNRGPLRLTEEGTVHPDILAAYWRHGFYVFENLVASAEIEDLRVELNDVLDRAPRYEGAASDARGRVPIGAEFERKTFSWVKPLADPVGGTTRLHGRHPVKMREPVPPSTAPENVIFMVFGICQIMESGLRLYGHPGVLTIAAGINGPDFAPDSDTVFIKPAHYGGSVAWHQDGLALWRSPDLDEGSHGFNMQIQLYRSTPSNGLWVVPGSHRHGKLDIAAIIQRNGGCERLPDAIPLVCEPGDVTVTNRQILHCSFANTSGDRRHSIMFNYHRRKSVLGLRVKTRNGPVVYDEERIFRRSRLIQVAIDARHQRYPNEQRYVYRPFVGLEDEYRYNAQTRESIVRNYNLDDLRI